MGFQNNNFSYVIVSHCGWRQCDTAQRSFLSATRALRLTMPDSWIQVTQNNLAESVMSSSIDLQHNSRKRARHLINREKEWERRPGDLIYWANTQGPQLISTVHNVQGHTHTRNQPLGIGLGRDSHTYRVTFERWAFAQWDVFYMTCTRGLTGGTT